MAATDEAGGFAAADEAAGLAAVDLAAVDLAAVDFAAAAAVGAGFEEVEGAGVWAPSAATSRRQPADEITKGHARRIK
ncbi:MAG TPA: hypothetical protein VHR17_12405 [Thermoanaerobaculia bacterium]|nr:hypothetical protein [Thermoanaerobaculia bacterium]